jgi:hypothetical protein
MAGWSTRWPVGSQNGRLLHAMSYEQHTARPVSFFYPFIRVYIARYAASLDAILMSQMVTSIKTNGCFTVLVTNRHVVILL